MFATDASTVCRFHPMVVMSQDMLSYEPNIMKLFGFTKKLFRLLSILLIQNRAFRFANGVIFLTKHAAKIIQQSCGNLKHIAYIPHGIGHDFKNIQKSRKWLNSKLEPIKCIYVSNAAMYKHQWVVVRAIAALRKRGYNINLTLVGGGTGRAQKLLIKQMVASDPQGIFIQQMDFIPQQELPVLLAESDIFLFASSCENLPVTLLEAMAVGLPIACSNRGPMPEVLADGGVYFDPEDNKSIADAVELLIKDDSLREKIAKQAKTLSQQYSWSRCADETWAFIKETHVKYHALK
jgi:glycosyltransferase involved in cell wall biosynthesis